MSGSEKKQTTSDASGLKSKLLLLIGSPVIVIFICSIVICVSAKRLENEPTGEPSTAEQNVLSNPSDNASAAAAVRSLIDGVITADDVKVGFTPSVEIELKKSNLPEKRAKLLSYAVSKTGERLSNEFFDSEKYSSSYGKPNTLESGLFPSDTSEAEFTESENGEYIYTFTPSEQNGGLFADDDKNMLAGIDEACKEFLPDADFKTEAESGTVTVKVTADPKTGRVKAIEKQRLFTVHITADGVNGEPLEITVQIKASGRFEIAFAGISITQDVIKIHGNGYDNLSITANVDENASQDEFSLEFISSDTSVCTVDKNGTVEAVKTSDKPVTVTVTLKYLGKTYTDSCLVYVTDEKDAKLSAAGAIRMSNNG